MLRGIAGWRIQSHVLIGPKLFSLSQRFAANRQRDSTILRRRDADTIKKNAGIPKVKRIAQCNQLQQHNPIELKTKSSNSFRFSFRKQQPKRTGVFVETECFFYGCQHTAIEAKSTNSVCNGSESIFPSKFINFLVFIPRLQCKVVLQCFSICF